MERKKIRKIIDTEGRKSLNTEAEVNVFAFSRYVLSCGKCVNVCSGMVLSLSEEGCSQMRDFERFG